MPTIKEFREFFSRNVQVNSGSKPDQEVGFPVSYLVNGISKFNRFLKGNFPSKDVMIKFIESITFKLNKEDRGQLTQQGLTVIATDANAESRISNATNGTEFTATTMPHQLPEIVLITDDNDEVIGTPAEIGGLKLSILRRTLSGLFRKNYKIEVNPDFSIVIDDTTKKIKLDGDTNTFDEDYYFYGINDGGTKTFYKLITQLDDYVLPKLRHKFVKEYSDTLSPTIITYTEISGTYIFQVDTLGSGTTNSPKTDYTINILFKDNIGGEWTNANSVAWTINHTTGDLTIPSIADGTVRVILVG